MELCSTCRVQIVKNMLLVYLRQNVSPDAGSSSFGIVSTLRKAELELVLNMREFMAKNDYDSIKRSLSLYPHKNGRPATRVLICSSKADEMDAAAVLADRFRREQMTVDVLPSFTEVEIRAKVKEFLKLVEPLNRALEPHRILIIQAHGMEVREGPLFQSCDYKFIPLKDILDMYNSDVYQSQDCPRVMVVADFCRKPPEIGPECTPLDENYLMQEFQRLHVTPCQSNRQEWQLIPKRGVTVIYGTCANRYSWKRGKYSYLMFAIADAMQLARALNVTLKDDMFQIDKDTVDIFSLNRRVSMWAPENDQHVTVVRYASDVGAAIPIVSSSILRGLVEEYYPNGYNDRVVLGSNRVLIADTNSDCTNWPTTIIPLLPCHKGRFDDMTSLICYYLVCIL